MGRAPILRQHAMGVISVAMMSNKITDEKSQRLACYVREIWTGRIRVMHGADGPVDDALNFIGVAEEMGLITDLFKQLLAQACRDARSWPDGTRLSRTPRSDSPGGDVPP